MADEDKIKDWNEAYRQAIEVWGPWLEEAKNDLAFVLGSQWVAADLLYLKNQERNALTFNRTRRVVNLIGGYQRKNRLALKIGPTEGSDEKTASQFSGIVQWAMETGHGYHCASNAFSAGLKVGLNLIHLFMDYREDLVNGDLKYKRIPHNRFLLDPAFTTQGLDEDCNYLLRREWLTKATTKSLLPKNLANEVEKMPEKSRDDKFVYAPVTKDLKGKDLLMWDEFYVKRTRPVKMLLDPYTTLQKPWRGDEARLREFLKDYPFVKVFDRQEEYIELNLIINGILISDDEEPSRMGGFPFVPVICFYDPEHDDMRLKLQGIVRCMRDPQTESNRRRSKLLDLLDTQLAGPKLVEEDALVTDKDAYQTGQGKVIWFKKDALSKGKFQMPTVPNIPPGMFQLSELMDRDIDDVAGVNAESFGTAENPDIQVAALLSQLRQSAGLTVLQDIFDNFRMSMKLVGQKSVRLIQTNWTPRKVERVINEKPTREFYDRTFGKYDCHPQEGILTESQRQMYFAQLIGLKQLGAPIPWTEIIEAAPIEYKERLKKAMAAEEQAMREAAQTDVMERKLTQSMMQSKILSDVAKAQENRAQAIENMGNATLDRIRTIREIGKLDDEHLMGLVDWIRGMEAQETIAPAAASPQGQPRGKGQVSYLTRR